jgi:hypothetical protein
MKKVILFFLLLFVCNFSVTGLDISLGQENYYAGETFQATITTTIDLIYDLTPTDFSLFSNTTEISISPFFYKLSSDQYYVYFDLDKDLIEGNYSLFIDNLVYFENSLLVRNNFTKNFQIEKLNETFSIFPGIVILDLSETGQIFNFFLENTGNVSSQVFISSSDSSLSPSISDIISQPDDTKFFDLYSDNLLLDQTSEQYITLESGQRTYTVPVWFDLIEEDVDDIDLDDDSSIEEGISFNMPVSEINIEINSNESLEGYVELQNNYDHPVSTINFELSEDLVDIVQLETETIYSVQPGEIIKVYLYVNSELNSESGLYEGDISFDTEYSTGSFPIFVNIKEDLVDSPNITQPSEQSCLNIECPSGWVCNSTSESCEPEKVIPQSNKKITGIILILLLVGLTVYFIYKKIKKRPKPSLPLPKN